MKRLMIPVLFLLSGCAIMDAYLMTKYDPNEYKIITDIRAAAQQFKNQCNDVDASNTNSKKLAFDAQTFKLYSEHVPRNEEVKKSAEELHLMASGLVELYAKGDNRVSPTFCKLKFENVERSANKIQTIVGRRPR
jgi:hypothetical protein